MGYIHLYCGDGKGKTTAAVGLTIRVLGRGGQAVIARFLKNDDSGEVLVLEKMDSAFVFPSEKNFGFTWQMTKEQREEAKAYYGELMDKAFRRAFLAAEKMPDILTVLILDEICAAVKNGFAEEEKLLKWLEQLPENLEIVMTGREPSAMMIERADYISLISKQKHPFDKGITARRGIEL